MEAKKEQRLTYYCILPSCSLLGIHFLSFSSFSSFPSFLNVSFFSFQGNLGWATALNIQEAIFIKVMILISVNVLRVLCQAGRSMMKGAFSVHNEEEK